MFVLDCGNRDVKSDAEDVPNELKRRSNRDIWYTKT